MCREIRQLGLARALASRGQCKQTDTYVRIVYDTSKTSVSTLDVNKVIRTFVLCSRFRPACKSVARFTWEVAGMQGNARECIESKIYKIWKKQSVTPGLPDKACQTPTGQNQQKCENVPSQKNAAKLCRSSTRCQLVVVFALQFRATAV